jgi:hypothetical protein
MATMVLSIGTSMLLLKTLASSNVKNLYNKCSYHVKVES